MGNAAQIKCALCRSEARPLWPEVRVCQCRSCGLMFRYPTSTQEDLQLLYRTSWTNPLEEIEETGATTPELADQFVSSLARTLGRNDLKGLRILDFGAGRGAMLQSMRAAGVEVIGVEPFGFEFLKQDGFQAFRSLDELPEGIVFDGVVSLDVIEHLAAPWEDYRRIKDLLRENGWLYLATPNAGGINARFSRAGWREIANRGHLFFFTAGTLRSALQASGYEKIQRLRWFTNYSKGRSVTLLHRFLQLAQLDGELRVLVFK